MPHSAGVPFMTHGTDLEIIHVAFHYITNAEYFLLSESKVRTWYNVISGLGQLRQDGKFLYSLYSKTLSQKGERDYWLSNRAALTLEGFNIIEQI